MNAGVERSPSDVLRLVVAGVVLAIVLALQWLFSDTLLQFMHDALRGLDAVPHWIIESIVVFTRVLAVVLIVGGFAYAIVHGRWRMLLTVALAGGVAALVYAVFDAIDESSPAPVTHYSHVLGQLDDGRFPTAVGIAVVAAVVTAGAPWLSRRWRRLGWVLVIGLLITYFVGSPVSFDSFKAVLDGWFCGALALVVLGAPMRRPTPAAVRQGLAGVGLPLAELEQASVDARGSTPYFGTGTDGRKLFVKVLGEDERSADLLFRTYRSVLPHDLGDERPFSSLRRAVEHEALVALAATGFGVRTPAIAGFASVEPNGFVLAYEAVAGRSLDRVADDEVTDAVLGSVWSQIAILRRHRVAHRDLRLANIFLADTGEVWMIDFGFSELAASDLLLATDLAELLCATSLRVGPDRAVSLARTVLPEDELSTAATRMRTYALSGATRTALKDRPGLLAELQAKVQPGQLV